MDSTSPQSVEQTDFGRRNGILSLWSSLRQDDWLRLPFEVMRSVGPATQTLAGLTRVTYRETYVPIAAIAEKAYLPVRTVKSHLVTLDKYGFVYNKGRQRTKSGNLRRTTTIMVDPSVRKMESYGILPLWACYPVKGSARLSWATKAVLSVIMAQLAAMKSVAGSKFDLTEEAEVYEAFVHDEGRFDYSLDKLAEKTGLERKAIIRAKRQLHKAKIVCWKGGKDSKRVCVTDSLIPNQDFRVVIREITPGQFQAHFTDEKTVMNQWKEYYNNKVIEQAGR